MLTSLRSISRSPVNLNSAALLGHLPRLTRSPDLLTECIRLIARDVSTSAHHAVIVNLLCVTVIEKTSEINVQVMLGLLA